MSRHLDITIDADTLKKVIRTVAPAASTDDSRPVLCGVNITTTSDGDIHVTATDSYQMHTVCLARTVATANIADSVTLPAEWLTRWTRTPTSRFNTARLSVAGLAATIDTGGESAVTRLITGKYPNWATMMLDPDSVTDHNPLVAVNPARLAAVLKAAAIWGHDLHPLTLNRLDPVRPCQFTVRNPLLGVARLLLMPVRSQETGTA